MNAVNVFMLLTPKSSVSFLFSNDTIKSALKKMRAHGYTSIPVLEEDGRYAGSVSEGDFLWSLVDCGGDLHSLSSRKVSEIIHENRNTAVRADVSMKELTERALNQNYAPVIDDRGYFIGIVTRRDVMSYLINLSNG